MIVFEKICWKNLLSFGETPTEVILNSGSMIAIRGKNSSGKSVFLEALSFGLFGRPFRKINKPKLVNIRNGKGLLVDIWFRSDGVQYHIRRGISPGIFEIYREGVLLDQNAATKDYQEYLERYILGIDYNSFNQIVVLGKASYTSFMRLSLDQRRKFIESMLDLNIFATMMDIHRKNVSQLKSDIREFKITFAVLKEKIELQEKHLLTLRQTDTRRKEEHVKNIQDQIDMIESEINLLSREIEQLDKSVPEDKSDLQILLKKVRSFEDLIRKANIKVRSFERELSVLNVKSCPTCHQEIGEEFRNRRESEIMDLVTEVRFAEDDIREKLKVIRVQIEEQEQIDSIKNSVYEKVRDLALEISLKKKSINILLNRKSEMVSDTEIIRQITEIENSVQKMKSEYDSLLSQKECFLNTLEQYEVITSLLGDSGIRKTVIRTFIPLINKSVNHFLARLNFPVRFTLGEDFSEEINTRGTSTGYYSCSEGEKEKIDLSLLLAWRDVAKVRSRFSCNILVFDEMFDSSLDLTSIESLITILRELDGVSIFVITHSNDYASEFNSTIFVEKQPNGFSRHVHETGSKNDRCG